MTAVDDDLWSAIITAGREHRATIDCAKLRVSLVFYATKGCEVRRDSGEYASIERLRRIRQIAETIQKNGEHPG